MCEGSLAMKKLKDKDSKCPNISFRSVNIMNEPFRSHIDWGANVDILEVLSMLIKNIPCEFCKSKISYFSPSIVQKNIRHFEITMDHTFFRQIKKSRKNIFDYGLGTLLWKMMLSPQFCLQVSPIANFSYNVTIAIRGKNFIAS